METPTIEQAEVIIEPGQEIGNIISKAIQQYGVTDMYINDLKEGLKGLTIAGVADKDGYEVVRKSIAMVRDLRSSVEKKRMDLNRNAIDYKKAVDEEAKRITGLLLEIETPLKQQKEFIDAEKARIKAEEEQRKHAQFVERTTALIQRGYNFNGSMYVNSDSIVTANDIREFSDGQWNEVLVRAEELFQQAQAEARAKAEAEAKAREEQEQKLAEQQRLIDEQNRQIQAQQLENERLQYENRTQWLINNGFKLENAYWEKNGYGLPDMIVLKSPSETWKHELTQVLNNIKTAEEAIAKIGRSEETAPVTEPEPAIAPAQQATELEPRTYEQGYEECRQAVLALFTDGKQRIKAQYITEIQSLKPQQP